MPHLELKQTQTVKSQLLLRLMGNLKIANLMNLSENDFKKLIQDIEQDSLFKELVNPGNKEKIISYKRFPCTDISSNFYELKEEIARDRSSFDVDSLVAKSQRAAEIIKYLGIDKFKKYFLYNDSGMTLHEVADDCGISIEKAEIVKEFLDKFAVHEEFFNPSFSKTGYAIPLENQTHYHKVAAIGKSDKEFIINYFSPSIARGKYSINYQKLEDLKKNECFNKQKIRKISSLINKLELINTRKTAMYRILEFLIKKQHRYLESGDSFNLIPYTQKELASQIDADPSLICRVIQGKSILILDGEEVPIKKLLPSRKRKTLSLIKEIIDEKDCLNDEKVRETLKEKFYILLSRRSISQYRKELKIPSIRQRPHPPRVVLGTLHYQNSGFSP